MCRAAKYPSRISLPGFVAVVAGSLAAATTGCGSDLPEVAPVHGLVTVDGRPLTSGTIRFWPDNGRPAHSTIAEDGTYRLTTFEPHDGAVLGNHTVTIEATKVHNAGPQINSLEEEMAHFSQKDAPRTQQPVVEWLAAERYSRPNESNLSATVTRGTNELNFPLEATSPATAR